MNPGKIFLVLMEIWMSDSLFNTFLNNYLRIFYTSFPPVKITVRRIKNSWITPGIRISCGRKKCLTRDNDDVNLKNYYKQYCKTLASVIKEAKDICIITTLLTLLIK